MIFLSRSDLYFGALGELKQGLLVRVKKGAAHDLESAKEDWTVQPALGILVWCTDKEDGAALSNDTSVTCCQICQRDAE